MTERDAAEPLRIEAPAKVNLCLEILGRRHDGYHAVTGVLQTVGLYDTLLFAPRDDGQVVVTTDSAALAEEPQDNLVWRAARLLQQARGVHAGAEITLEKRIPLAAGLGGGSSDAMAALRGLDRLWDLRLQESELLNVASLLGSDVPFFLHGGTALVEGRGERVTPLRPLAGGWFVLVTPELPLAGKTAAVYHLLRPYERTDGALTQRLVATLAAGRRPPATLLYNGLEDAAFRAFPGLNDVLQAVVAAGGESARVSGAGPSLYLYYAEEAPARALWERLQAADVPAHLVEPAPGSGAQGAC
jgi:4-diphosphocytidyl-2-C-methyl-D-erythritol kinase